MVTLGFGLIGFYDDYLKVTRQTHKGFSGRARLAIEFAVALFAAYFVAMTGTGPLSTSFTFPFFKEVFLNLGIFFYVPVAAPSSSSAPAMPST